MELLSASGISAVATAYTRPLLRDLGYTDIQYRPRSGRGGGIYLCSHPEGDIILGACTRRIGRGESQSMISPEGLSSDVAAAAREAGADSGYIFAFARTDSHDPNEINIVVVDRQFLTGLDAQAVTVRDDGRMRLSCNPLTTVISDAQRSQSVRLSSGVFPPF